MRCAWPAVDHYRVIPSISNFVELIVSSRNSELISRLALYSFFSPESMARKRCQVSHVQYGTGCELGWACSTHSAVPSRTTLWLYRLWENVARTKEDYRCEIEHIDRRTFPIQKSAWATNETLSGVNQQRVIFRVWAGSFAKRDVQKRSSWGCENSNAVGRCGPMRHETLLQGCGAVTQRIWRTRQWFDPVNAKLELFPEDGVVLYEHCESCLKQVLIPHLRRWKTASRSNAVP